MPNSPPTITSIPFRQSGQCPQPVHRVGSVIHGGTAGCSSRLDVNPAQALLRGRTGKPQESHAHVRGHVVTLGHAHSEPVGQAYDRRTSAEKRIPGTDSVDRVIGIGVCRDRGRVRTRRTWRCESVVTSSEMILPIGMSDGNEIDRKHDERTASSVPPLVRSPKSALAPPISWPRA